MKESISKRLIDRMNSRAVIDLRSARRITGKSAAYTRLLLHRLVKAKKVRRIEQGKFTIANDPLVVAANITHPSYLSLWSALRFWNLTEQLPCDIFVVTNRQRKPIHFESTTIRFVFQKKLLSFVRKNVGQFEIFVAEPETLVIEAILHARHVPLREVVNALRSKELDTARLASEAKKIGDKALMKRLGFILWRLRLPVHFSPPKSTNVTLLDRNMPDGGMIDRRWMIRNNNEALFHDIA